MARGRSVTLKGPAAQAFVEAMQGKRAETDDEKAMRVCTFIRMELEGRPQVAIRLLKLVAKEGLDAAVKVCTG